MGGAGGMPTACGNGLIEVSEDCDDGNTIDGDGCTGCAVDIGYACTGEPSTCAIKPPIEVQTGISIGITDTANHYNGTLASMDCLTLAVGSTDSPQIVQDIKLQVGIDHSYLGDLILKLVSPDNTVLTLMNRPGADEPADGYAENPNGDSSNLSSGYLIEFHDGALVSAESMGDTISGSDVVCKDDGICDFKPAPGKGPGFGFIDFKNKKASGFWRLCAADGDDGDSGTLAFGKLTIWLQ